MLTTNFQIADLNLDQISDWPKMLTIDQISDYTLAQFSTTIFDRLATVG